MDSYRVVCFEASPNGIRTRPRSSGGQEVSQCPYLFFECANKKREKGKKAEGREKREEERKKRKEGKG